MKKKTISKVAVAFIIILSLSAIYLGSFFDEETITIVAGRETPVKIRSLYKFVSLVQNTESVAVNGNLDSSYNVNARKNLIFLSNDEGVFDFTVNIFNGIPIKHLTVNVLPDENVYVGGELIGVRLDTAGVIAVGFGIIETPEGNNLSPAQEAGIREGDIVKKVNGIEINKASEFKELINSLSGEEVKISVIRNDEMLDITIKPVLSKADKTHKIGLWVRDNVSGVGTLTFITQDQREFAALGHSITDATTDIVVPIKNGDLLATNIINVVKSEKSMPGEIHGIFSDTHKVYGSVKVNNEFGIYGKYLGGFDLDNSMLMPIATQDEIVEGPALMICNIDDEKKAYEIIIKQINYQNTKNSKSMLIEVVDQTLLEKTGGIIQGMSGSPIVQNGKLIGAVTHVMVNDPTEGYAVFIEWMLNNLY